MITYMAGVKSTLFSFIFMVIYSLSWNIKWGISCTKELLSYDLIMTKLVYKSFPRR